jgi:hypothetical protein
MKGVSILVVAHAPAEHIPMMIRVLEERERLLT